MELLKLGTAAMMKVNVPLPFSVRDEAGSLLLAKGRSIVNKAQLEMLMSRGVFVDREEYKVAVQAAAQKASAGARDQAADDSPKLTTFDLWEQSIWALDRLLRNMATEPGFPARMDAFAARFVAQVDRDPDIAIFISMRQDERRMALYGLTHSLHTALVCRLMARRLEWPEDRQQTLLKAALTMNVAMLDLQGRLAAQGGTLTEDQQAQVRSHPEQGSELLRAAGVADEGWLSAVRDHHERADGTGYPRGATDMSELAAALRVADVFMAKISPRTNRASLSIQEAARQMFQESKGSPVAAAIIKEYGVYPPGDLVQLASGETAVVVHRGAAVQTPIVMALTDRMGMVTLTPTRRDTSHSGFAITGPARDKKLALPVSAERLFGLTR